MIQNKYELAISTFIYSINLGSKHALSGVLAIDDYYNLSLCYKKKGDFENALSSLMTSNSLYKKEEKKELNEYIIDLKFIHELELLENEKNLEIHKKEVERHEKYSIIVFTFSLFVMGIVLIILYKLKQKKNKILAIKNLELTVLLKNTSKKRTIKDSRDKNFSHELIINLEKLFKVDKVYTDKKLTLEKLAKLLKTNRSYLSENVNVYYGKPFRSVLNTFRITEAKLALIDDRFKNYSIEGVALTVGYGNMSSFNSAFKKETGITPSYFRKEYLNSKNINNEFILCNTTKTFSG